MRTAVVENPEEFYKFLEASPFIQAVIRKRSGEVFNPEPLSSFSPTKPDNDMDALLASALKEMA